MINIVEANAMGNSVWEVWRGIFGVTSHENPEQSGELTDRRLKRAEYWKQLPKFKDNRYRSPGVGRRITLKSRDQCAEVNLPIYYLLLCLNPVGLNNVHSQEKAYLLRKCINRQ